MNIINTLIAENLKATVGQAQRYTLVALSSAALFAVLTLPSPSAGDVKWQLLGVPVAIAPPLALVVLYLAYLGSCLLADNMLLHVRDLADKLGDLEQTRAVLSYPTALTVSPVGRFCATVLPAVLVILGLGKIHWQSMYQLHPVAWFFAYTVAGATGLSLYSRAQRCLKPNLYPERQRPKAKARSDQSGRSL